MYSSKDGLIYIEIAKDLSQVVFPPADFSVIEVPEDTKKAADIFHHLFDTPTRRHLLLLLFRGRRLNQLKSISNVTTSPFELLDFIHMKYDKASSSSNQGFLPIVELGIVMFKGLRPNLANTKWFSENNSNATNFWDLSAQPGELSQYTHYQRVCWEVLLLMYSLASPREYQRMIYGLKSQYDSVIALCKLYGIAVQLYVNDAREAEKILVKYQGK